MTFSFFRRHKKFFWVLIGLGVLGFVGFGTWASIWQHWAEWTGMSESRRVVAYIGQDEVHNRDLFGFYIHCRAGGHAARALYLTLGMTSEKAEFREAVYGLTIGLSAWPLVARDLPNEEPAIMPLVSWYALYREAVRRGFEPSDLAVEERLRGLASLGMSPAMLQNVLRQAARGEMTMLRDAFRADMALRAYVDWMADALSTAAEPELRERFVRMDERLKLRLAVLKAEDFLDRIAPPSDEVLRRQFEANKVFPAGGGPDGYGYRIPDRVRLEYLAADPAAFEDEARAAVTEAAIKQYYEENKDPEFLVKKEPPGEPEKGAGGEKPEAPKPPEGPAKPAGKSGPPGEPGAAGEPGAEAAPKPEQAAPPPKPEPPKEFLPLDAVRDRIKDTLTREEAKRLARTALSNVVAQVRGIRKPEDLRIWADGEKIRHEPVERFLSAAEIGELDGLGRASDGRRYVADVATAIPELAGPGKGRIALHEISDTFADPDGRAYAFRVTAFQPHHVPESLDLVRDEVLADVKRQAAFDLARERAAKVRELAADKGLVEAANQLGLKPPVETDWFPREQMSRYYFLFGGERTTTPSLPEIGVNPTFVREAFELRPGGRERTLVTLAPQRMVVVAELVGRRPPREAAFEVFRSMLADEVARDLGAGAMKDVIDPAAVRARFAITVLEAERERAAEPEPVVPADD